VALALMLLVGLGLVWSRGSTGGPAPVPAGPALRDYPAAIVPQPDPPPLPADRAVGPGLLVFHGAGGFVLAASAGAQYRLDPSATSYKLSPDGRWLAGSVIDHSTVMRDLTAAGPGFDLPGSPVAWSPDGRWVALGASQTDGPMPDNPGVVHVADLTRPQTTPRPVDLTGFTHTMLVSVRADGDLVLEPLDFEGSLNLSLVDPATLAVRRRIYVNLFPFLNRAGPGAIALVNQVFLPDGLVYLHAERPLDGSSPAGAPYYPVAVLQVDISSGSGTARDEWSLPTPRPTGGGRREFWMLMRVLPEGMLLRHLTPAGTASWDLYQPGTGRLTTVTDLRAVDLT
jgi:hypothetical protein